MYKKFYYLRIAQFMLIILLLSNFIYSSDYYGNFNIIVTDTGTIFFDSKTNYPLLNINESDDFTLKKAKFWVLNITINDTFSDYIYYINFPKGTSINYIKTKSLSRIESTDNGITIIGTGKNQNFEVLIQYSFNEQKSINQKYLFYITLFAIIIVLLSFIFALIINKYFFQNKINIKNKQSLDSQLKQENYEEIIFKKKIILTQRQQLIVDLLKKEDLSQTEIMNKLNLVKSSVSRNIDSLEKKGIVIKKQKGIINIISLNK
jgi:biotin operon repressor